jgi:hypothetical protein
VIGTAAIASDPQLAGNALGFGSNGIVFEGATGDAGNALEGFLTVEDITGSDKTWTLPDLSGTLGIRIASGAEALATSAIASEACSTADTGITATGTLTSDAISWSFASDPVAVTGYAPVTEGGLSIYVYPTADAVNFKICNPTTASITPGAMTLNWRVMR